MKEKNDENQKETVKNIFGNLADHVQAAKQNYENMIQTESVAQWEATRNSEQSFFHTKVGRKNSNKV